MRRPYRCMRGIIVGGMHNPVRRPNAVPRRVAHHRHCVVDDNDAVYMIRHHDGFIDPHVREMIRDLCPDPACHRPKQIHPHAATYDLPKQGIATLRADGNEIGA